MARLPSRQWLSYRPQQQKRSLQCTSPLTPALTGEPSPLTLNPQQQITLHQSFTLNNTHYYTLFPLPISVTNSIPASSSRPSCALLTNPLLDQAALDASADTIPAGAYPWTDGRGVQTGIPEAGAATSSMSGMGGGGSGGGGGGAMNTGAVTGMESSMVTGTGSSSAATSTPAFGDPKPDATPEDGLGAGAVLRPVVSLQVLLMVLGLGLYIYI
jgi:hypothetical protein